VSEIFPESSPLTGGHADEVPDMFARYMRSGMYPGRSDAEIAKWWKHLLNPGERDFWRGVIDVAPATVTGGQPARADEFARVKVRLSALVASLDETVCRTPTSECGFDQGAAHASAVTARQLREILNDTALGTTPQPAPELAETPEQAWERRTQAAGTAPELAAAIDPVKLDLLAAWLDQDDAIRERLGNPEVQDDLRRWAKAVRDYRQHTGQPS
jgi:hypothetical protein